MHATPHHMAALKQRAYIGPARAKAGGREHTSQAPQPRGAPATGTAQQETTPLPTWTHTQALRQKRGADGTKHDRHQAQYTKSAHIVIMLMLC